jgi:hypothetical protein
MSAESAIQPVYANHAKCVEVAFFFEQRGGLAAQKNRVPGSPALRVAI